MKEPNAMSFHVKYKPEDFMPANEEEKQSQVIMRESVGFWQDGFRRLRKNKVAMVSLFVIIVVMIFSFIVPAFYPYDYKTQIKGSENLHPMQYSEKEIERMDAGEKVFPHVLGTDKMGRDYAIRVMMGSRISLMVGLIATAIILVIGSIYGSVAAFFGGWVDIVLQRITEIVACLPFLPMAMILTSIIGNSMTESARIALIMVILGILSWPSLARLVRAQVLAEREQEFVTAANAMGVKRSVIVFKHIIPNVISVIIVSATLDFAYCMLTESTLSFLGFGVKLPRPTWGNMLNGCVSSVVIQNYWWRWVFPAIMLGICVICINMVGDGLRDAIDPKSNER